MSLLLSATGLLVLMVLLSAKLHISIEDLTQKLRIGTSGALSERLVIVPFEYKYETGNES